MNYALNIFETEIFEFKSELGSFVLEGGRDFVVEGTGVEPTVFDAFQRSAYFLRVNKSITCRPLVKETPFL